MTVSDTTLRTTRRAFAFGVTVAVVALLTFGLLFLFAGRERVAVEQSRAVSRLARQALTLAVDRETGVRGFLLTHDSLSLEPEFQARQQLGRVFDELRSTTQGTPEQSMVAKTEAAEGRWVSEFALPAIERPGSIGTAGDQTGMAGKLLFDHLRDRFTILIDAEHRAFKEASDAAAREQRRMAVAAVISSMLLLITLALMRRLVLSQLRVVVDQQGELRDQNTQLLVRGQEMEDANVELETLSDTLQEQAVELEDHAAALLETNGELERARAAADAARRTAEATERQLQTVFAQAPAAISVTAGPDHRFVLVNRNYEEIVGRPVTVGQTFRDALPELLPQGYEALLDQVYRTGKPYAAREAAAQIDKGGPTKHEGWFDFVYQPLIDGDGSVAGILQHAVEVTGQVRARQDVERLLRESEESRAELVAVNAALASEAEQRRRSERKLGESEERFRAVFDQAAVGIAVLDLDGHWRRVNTRLCEIVGYSPEEMRQRTFIDIGDPDGREADAKADAKAMARLISGELGTYQVVRRYIHAQGHSVWVNITVGILRGSTGAAESCVAVIEDISEHRRVEDQLRQSQKMEAVGQLAGGVAHDFNNLLTVITGYAAMSLQEMPTNDASRESMQEIAAAADHAAALTRQLLTFSRQQVQESQIVRLNETIVDSERMLRRLLPEHISVTTALAPDTGMADVDPEQVSQILINLVVNARDAMPDGGTLAIETACVELDEDYCAAHATMSPGHYAMLSVADTGTGMTAQTLEHVFEPFFTTKEQGKGTGLGLATVYGIVKQSKGHIWVYSEVGLGTTFKIYFPSVRGTANVEPAPPEQAARGLETILVVDDNPAVRKVVVTALRRGGYTVHEAADGAQALAHLDVGGVAPDLVVTDVVMPTMGARELVPAVRMRAPGAHFLLMTGYSRDRVGHAAWSAGAAFIEKPFTGEALLRRVRDVFDGSAAEARQ